MSIVELKIKEVLDKQKERNLWLEQYYESYKEELLKFYNILKDSYNISQYLFNAPDQKINILLNIVISFFYIKIDTQPIHKSIQYFL